MAGTEGAPRHSLRWAAPPLQSSYGAFPPRRRQCTYGATAHPSFNIQQANIVLHRHHTTYSNTQLTHICRHAYVVLLCKHQSVRARGHSSMHADNLLTASDTRVHCFYYVIPESGCVRSYVAAQSAATDAFSRPTVYVRFQISLLDNSATLWMSDFKQQS